METDKLKELIFNTKKISPSSDSFLEAFFFFQFDFCFKQVRSPIVNEKAAPKLEALME